MKTLVTIHSTSSGDTQQWSMLMNRHVLRRMVRRLLRQGILRRRLTSVPTGKVKLFVEE